MSLWTLKVSGYMGFKAKAGLLLAHPVKQTLKEFPLLRIIYTHMFLHTYFTRKKQKIQEEWDRAQNRKVNTLCQKKTLDKSTHFTSQGNKKGWDETVPIEVLSLITLKFKYSPCVNSFITRELQYYILYHLEKLHFNPAIAFPLLLCHAFCRPPGTFCCWCLVKVHVSSCMIYNFSLNKLRCSCSVFPYLQPYSDLLELRLELESHSHFQVSTNINQDHDNKPLPITSVKMQHRQLSKERHQKWCKQALLPFLLKSQRNSGYRINQWE